LAGIKFDKSIGGFYFGGWPELTLGTPPHLVLAHTLSKQYYWFREVACQQVYTYYHMRTSFDRSSNMEPEL